MRDAYADADAMNRPDGAADAELSRLAELQPDLVRLAECLCLTAGIERAFLRRARLRFLPRTTAGLEAELWFSPLVEAAGDHMLLLDPAWSEALRRRLANGPHEHAIAVWEFTSEAHREAPPVIRWFEELLWAGLFPTADGHERVKDGLARMLLAVTTSEDEAADDLGRWALHYLSRLPVGVLRHDDAWRIQVASSERLGLDPPHDPFSRPASVATGARALVQRDVVIGVAARSGGLVLSSPAAPDSVAIRASGGHTVRLDVASSLEPPPHMGPVHVELRTDQSVLVPFTVIQRLSRSGQPRWSMAHARRALEVVVAAGGQARAPEPRHPHLAVLLGDGTIVLHDHEGEAVAAVPAPSNGAQRRSVALSARGTTLAWVEDGAVHQCEVAPERGPVQVARGEGEVIAVHFPPGAGEHPSWEVLSGGSLVLHGRHALAEPFRRVDGGARAVVPFFGDRPALLDELGRLWHCRMSGDHQLLADSVTAITCSEDGIWLVATQRNGSVLGWARGRARHGSLVGRVPWEATDLAVDAAGTRVAVVGGDGRVLVWDLTALTPQSEEIRLEFAADRVFAHPSGGWTVAGCGGPVELRTEDGRRYVVSPDHEPDLRPDGVPSWILGSVLAEITPSGLWGDQTAPSEVMRDVAEAGVRCLLVGPLAPPPFPDPTRPDTTVRDGDTPFDGLGRSVRLIEAARRHGVRFVVDLDLTGEEFDRMSAVAKARVYDGVRQWLDRGADGVRISGAATVGRRFLRDLRHLLQGYDGRVLIENRPWELADAHDAPVTAGGLAEASHVASLCLSPDTTLALALRIQSYTLGSDHSDAYAARLAQAQRALTTACQGAQWAHTLPEQLLLPEQQALAAAVLLSLPGCPTLPLDLLREQRTAALLRLRRAHLALSKGTLQLLHFGGPEVLAVLRRHGSETILCLANSAPERRTVSLPSDLLPGAGAMRVRDLFDGGEVEHDNPVPVDVSVGGLGVRWLLLTPIRSEPGPRE
ncbi:alpha-glucosidase C-terminal domain-containing protein [Streptomyces sp. NPDC013489]|uniref:alpha-glucosidase C-terminal domain-containing protein n=1 Tax=Streptomyces sp. NPDC013489 TaxID=3155606 RepID=UPI0033D40CCF